MTKHQYLNLVEHELSILNDTIDRKIISGLGYNSEARRHKRLLGLTREFRREGFMQKLFGARNTYAR